MNINKYVIIMAAGKGVRLGADIPKQFLEVNKRAILVYTIEKFIEAIPDIKIILVLPKSYIKFWQDYCLENNIYYSHKVVPGGITRFHSVLNALKYVPKDAIVGVHDGVRPLITHKFISSIYKNMIDNKLSALIPVVPVTDTLKPLRKENERLSLIDDVSLDRNILYAAQTPQLFKADLIKSAYESLPFEEKYTDDASVLSAMKIPLSFCIGEKYNIKITTPEDLELANKLLMD